MAKDQAKKVRKRGRNKVYCEWYRRVWQREKNQLRNLKKHMAGHPNDLVAGVAFRRCQTILGHIAKS
jgi:hypothetical protein